MNLANLEKSDIGPVWVYNSSKGDKRSIIFFSVQKPNSDRSDTVKVPITFIPLDLTQQIPKKQLLQSSEFRRAINLGYLTLISEAEAAKIMETPVAKRELERVILEEQTIVEASASASLGKNDEEGEMASPEVAPRIQNFIDMLAESDPESAQASLRNLGALENSELRLIRKAAADYPKMQELVAYCDEEIAAANA